MLSPLREKLKEICKKPNLPTRGWGVSMTEKMVLVTREFHFFGAT